MQIEALDSDLEKERKERWEAENLSKKYYCAMYRMVRKMMEMEDGMAKLQGKYTALEQEDARLKKRQAELEKDFQSTQEILQNREMEIGRYRANELEMNATIDKLRDQNKELFRDWTGKELK